MGAIVLTQNRDYCSHPKTQIFLLWGIFGYLCGMIVYKWWNVFPSVELPDGTLQPTDPSLLVALVNMFLKPGQVRRCAWLLSLGSSSHFLGE